MRPEATGSSSETVPGRVEDNGTTPMEPRHPEGWPYGRNFRSLSPLRPTQYKPHEVPKKKQVSGPDAVRVPADRVVDTLKPGARKKRKRRSRSVKTVRGGA